MVSIRNIHVVGSAYMGLHGGFKPRPQAFIHYFKSNKMSPKRLFFIGNRLVDMKLATAIKERLGVEVFKCLLIRDHNSVALRYADKVVHDLWSVRELIDKYKPDLILSDFDNTLVYSGYEAYEGVIENLRFWERVDFPLLRYAYAFASQLSIPFLKKHAFDSKHDNTEAFIRTLKCPLLIHTMSPEMTVWIFLKKLLK